MRYLLRLGLVLLALVALAIGALVVSPVRAAAPDPQPNTGCTGSYYVIQHGDHLYRLALRFGTTVSAITGCNHLANPDQIYAGQRILIPNANWQPSSCSCSAQPCDCPPASTCTPGCPPATAVPCNCSTATPAPTPTPAATPEPTSTPAQCSCAPCSCAQCSCATCACPTAAPPVFGCTCPGGSCPPAGPGLPLTPAAPPAPATCDCPGTTGAACNCRYGLTHGEYDPGSNYTVQKGDTLYSIARRYGTTVNALMAANGLTDPDRIRSGQTLRMPGTR